MYDKDYNFGGSSDDGYGSDDGQQANPLALILKFLPIIIVGIIIIGALLFGLNWVTSNRTITFAINELDGPSHEGALALTLDGKPVKLATEGTSSTFTQKLAPGTYTYRVTAAGFKPETGSITIPGSFTDGDTKSIFLKKDITATLSATSTDTQIFKDQVITGSLVISNTGQTDMQLITIDANTSKQLTVTLAEPRVSLSAGGGHTVDFTITQVAAVTAPTDLSVKFKLRGTLYSTDLKVTANPSVSATKVTVVTSPTAASATKSIGVKAGEKKLITITVTNPDTKIPLKDVTISLEPVETSLDKTNWITFDGYVTKKTEITIPSIAPKEKKDVILYITSDKTAEINDVLETHLVITSPSIDTKKDIVLNFTVTSKDTATLLVTVTNPIAVTCTLSKNPDECPLQPTAKMFAFKNTGTITIPSIKAWIVPNPDVRCPSWITIPTGTTISNLAKGDTDWLIGSITVEAQTPEPNYANCTLKWEYADPLDPVAPKISGSENFRVDRTIKP